MKTYPIDKWASIMVWPMDAARRSRSKALKVFLVLAYFPWFLLLGPVTTVLLFVSMAMAIWDDINQEPK